MAYETHPYAEVWPSLEGPDFDKLVDDIQRNGQRLPIILHGGKILDGRNRDRACLKLGIEARYEIYAGTDEQAMALVRSLNEHRRHLTLAQKLESANKLIELHPDMSSREAAAQTGVSHTSINALKKKSSGGKSLHPNLKVIGKNKVAQTVINASQRESRDAKIIADYRKGRTQKDIATAMDIGTSTVNDVLQKAGLTQSRKNHKNGKKMTRMEMMELRMKGTKPLQERALTREQVDPEFTGSAMDWVDKYGHVQLEGAEQRATMRFTDWAIELGHIAKVIKSKQLPELDVNWLRSPKKADVERMTQALDVLRPIIARADEMLKQVAE